MPRYEILPQTMLTFTLAQSRSVGSMLFWILVLIVVVVIGGAVIFTLRKRMLSRDDSISVGSSGLLDHLHQLHRSGQLSDEEFARARSAVLEQVQDDIESRKASAEHKPKAGGLDLDRYTKDL